MPPTIAYRRGHEGVGQAIGIHLDRTLLGERGVGDLAEQRQVQQMIRAQPVGPLRKLRVDLRAHVEPAFKFDHMPLAVVETDRLDVRIAIKRPGQAGGGVLSSGKEDEGMSWIGHRAMVTKGASGRVRCCSRVSWFLSVGFVLPHRAGGAKARVGRPGRADQAVVLRPTALRCSDSWPVGKLPSLTAFAVVKQCRRVRGRSALTRAATSPALLSAFKAHPGLPTRAFAVALGFLVEKASWSSSGRRHPPPTQCVAASSAAAGAARAACFNFILAGTV